MPPPPPPMPPMMIPWRFGASGPAAAGELPDGLGAPPGLM